MEAKLRTLEELCELMTIQIVTQNQSFINANCNLINEIRNLRDVIKKQDDDFAEFKVMMKNIEINQQQLAQTVQNQKLIDKTINEQLTLSKLQPKPVEPPIQVVETVVKPQMVQSISQEGQINKIEKTQTGIFQFGSPTTTQTQKPTEVKPFKTENIQTNVTTTSPKFDFGAKITVPPPLLPKESTIPINVSQTKQQTIPQIQLPQQKITPQSSLQSISLTQPQTQQQKSPFTKTEETPFGNKILPSFADLAKGSSNLFGSPLQTTTKSPFSGGGITNLFGTSTQATPLFASQSPSVKTTEDGGEGEESSTHPEEYEPNVDFKPVVKLAEVDVKTGEEDEEILFKSRCKLYRFSSDTKEWKEKGVGEIKVLKHKTHGTHRILMRRDQVLKLCANHRITNDLKLELLHEKQITWSALDYSETEGKFEILAAKFRHPDDAKKFKDDVEGIQKSLGEVTPIKSSGSQEKINKNLQQNIKNLVKVEPGTWSCTECLAQNNRDASKCACCEHVRATEPSKNNEITIVKEVKASPEQILKAKKYQLPENFYLYENQKECIGCRGCRNEE